MIGVGCFDVFFSRSSHSTAGKSEKTVASQVTSKPVCSSVHVILCRCRPSAAGSLEVLRFDRCNSSEAGLPP